MDEKYKNGRKRKKRKEKSEKIQKSGLEPPKERKMGKNAKKYFLSKCRKNRSEIVQF